MYCQGLVLARTLAAEFSTYWSVSRVLLGNPNRTSLLYYSSPDMDECMTLCF